MVDKLPETLAEFRLKTHEDICRARLGFQHVQWASGKWNSQFADKGHGVQVNVGVAVTLTEAERVKLHERWTKAQQALAEGQVCPKARRIAIGNARDIGTGQR